MSEESLINDYGFKIVFICPEEDENYCLVKKIKHEFLGDCEISVFKNTIQLYCSPKISEPILLLERKLNKKNLDDILNWLMFNK